MERPELFVSLSLGPADAVHKKPPDAGSETCDLFFFCACFTFSDIQKTLLFFAFGSSVASLVIVLIHHQKSVPVLESYILEPVALFSSIVFTYYNHTRQRTSSSILLIFWPVYVVALVIWARTISLRDLDHYRLLLILKGCVAVFGLASFALECIGPEIGLPKDEKSIHENPILTANIFSQWVCVFIFCDTRSQF